MPERDRLESEEAARSYLVAELGDRAPSKLVYEGRFEENPLDDQGPAVVFSFHLTNAQAAPACGNTGSSAESSDATLHYVVVGHTTPNYFPAYDLNPDEAYSLHLGTHFALVLEIGLTDSAAEPPDGREKLQRVIAELSPGARIDDLRLAGLFRAVDQLYAVYFLNLNGQEMYFMGGDLQPGFYAMTRWPPQVAMRLHLGKLIRAEAASE